MNILKITLTFKNDFHTTGETKGALLDFLKDHNGNPYIPATHIKGIMRCEGERILRTIKDIPCFITGDPAAEEPDIKLCDEITQGKFKCDICRIFGVPNTEGGREYREGIIRITDFKTNKENNLQSSRMHISINRDTQTNSKKALFKMNTVPQNTQFTGYILIKKQLSKSEKQLLCASLHSMAHYGFGKDRTRGIGGIEPQDGLKIVKITHEEYLKETAQ